MAALTGPRITPTLGVPVGGGVPAVYAAPLGIADNVHIFAGALISVDSSGYMRPARATNTDFVIGLARTDYDNTVTGHAAGALSPEAQLIVSGWDNDGSNPILATTAPGTTLYAVDDHTVSLSSNSSARPAAGILWMLGSDGFVYVIPPLLAGGV